MAWQRPNWSVSKKTCNATHVGKAAAAAAAEIVWCSFEQQPTPQQQQLRSCCVNLKPTVKATHCCCALLLVASEDVNPFWTTSTETETEYTVSETAHSKNSALNIDCALRSYVWANVAAGDGIKRREYKSVHCHMLIQESDLESRNTWTSLFNVTRRWFSSSFFL